MKIRVKVVGSCLTLSKKPPPPFSNPGYAPAFYDIFAPQKVPFLKIYDDVIACDLLFGPPPIKNPGYVYACEPGNPIKIGNSEVDNLKFLA